jgi:hypothetical protein
MDSSKYIYEGNEQETKQFLFSVLNLLHSIEEHDAAYHVEDVLVSREQYYKDLNDARIDSKRTKEKEESSFVPRKSSDIIDDLIELLLLYKESNESF